MIRHLKYWAFILLFSYGPTILVHYAIRPFWFDKTDGHTGLTSLELIFTVLILPVYLVILNYWQAKKYGERNFFIINAAIIISCILISSRLHFLNWADSVGNRDNPDFGTREVAALEEMSGLILATIGIIIAFIRLYNKKKAQA